MRKYATLWTLFILFQHLAYGKYVIKGFIYDSQGNVYCNTIINHRLLNLESSFEALAFFYAVILLLRPDSRPIWRCSIFLMACAILTNLATHFYLRGNMMSGLMSFIESGGIVRFLTNSSYSFDRLFTLPRGSIGFSKVISYFRYKSEYAVHDGTIVLVLVWIVGASVLLISFFSWMSKCTRIKTIR